MIFVVLHVVLLVQRQVWPPYRIRIVIGIFFTVGFLGSGPICAAVLGWRLAKTKTAAKWFFLAVVFKVLEWLGVLILAYVLFSDGDRLNLRHPTLQVPLPALGVGSALIAIAGILIGGLFAATRVTNRWPRSWPTRRGQTLLEIVAGAMGGAIVGCRWEPWWRSSVFTSDHTSEFVIRPRITSASLSLHSCANSQYWEQSAVMSLNESNLVSSDYPARRAGLRPAEEDAADRR